MLELSRLTGFAATSFGKIAVLRLMIRARDAVATIRCWARSRGSRWSNVLARHGQGMRLRSKIFLSSALVILVLAGVSVLSLAAVGRLVSANADIANRAIPALSLTASTREAITPLLRLETRAFVLGEARYASGWRKLAAEIGDDLDRIATYALSDVEVFYLGKARAAFDEYRRIVADEQALMRRGDRARVLALAEKSARLRAEEVEESLDALMAATRARVTAAQAEAARVEARTWTAVLSALGVAVALALLGTAIIARRITRSLELLSSATANLAADDFSQPIAIEGQDEIAALAHSFNSMACQLREMEQTKQKFFAIVAHELRSPLTSIRGAVELLHRGAPGSLTNRQERLTDIIGQSCERLLRLVKEILEVSRFRAGLIELDRQPLDLAALVDRVVEELHPQAADAGVALERERYGAEFTYMGDAERLYQLVANLGTNAIRFTPRGGRVVVQIVDAATEFEVVVEDNGVGIPAAALPNIFDPYCQAHHDRGGTGLGLAIVRGVANAHGGHVTVDSCEGKGSRFSVHLPRSSCASSPIHDASLDLVGEKRRVEVPVATTEATSHP